MQHLTRIFPLQSQWINKDRLHKQHLKSDRNNMTLLLGDQNMYILSMLFQASVTFGYEDRQIVFICKNVFKTMPFPVHGMPKPSPDMMTQLKVIYFTEQEELIEYLANFHTMAVLPDVLVISDVFSYATQCKFSARAYEIESNCALIDAVFTVLSSHGKFQSLVSSSDTNVNHDSIYGRYFSDICHINRISPDIFQCIKKNGEQNEDDHKITYSCVNGSLMLCNYYISGKGQRLKKSDTANTEGT